MPLPLEFDSESERGDNNCVSGLWTAGSDIGEVDRGEGARGEGFSGDDGIGPRGDGVAEPQLSLLFAAESKHY